MFRHINPRSATAATATGLVLASMTTCTALIVKAISRTHREAEVSFEAGYELGMDAGYKEGRRTARPVLVPFVTDDPPGRRGRIGRGRRATAPGVHTAG